MLRIEILRLKRLHEVRGDSYVILGGKNEEKKSVTTEVCWQ